MNPYKYGQVVETDFQRRTYLLNSIGRLLLARSDGHKRKVAEFLEEELKKILAAAEAIP